MYTFCAAYFATVSQSTASDSKQAENDRFFADRAVAAGAAGKTGFAKEAEELNSEIAKRTSFVDERGAAHRVPLTGASWTSIIDEARKKFDAFKDHVTDSNHKVTAAAFKEEEELVRKRLEWDGKLFEERLKHNAESVVQDYEQTAKVYGFEEQVADEEGHQNEFERQVENIRRFGLSYLALQSFGAATAPEPT